MIVGMELKMVVKVSQELINISGDVVLADLCEKFRLKAFIQGWALQIGPIRVQEHKWEPEDETLWGDAPGVNRYMIRQWGFKETPDATI